MTGGGGALGGAIAVRLASVGLRIAVVDLDVGRAKETTRTITVAGGVAQAYGCDLRSAEVIEDMFRRAEADQGPISMRQACGPIDDRRRSGWRNRQRGFDHMARLLVGNGSWVMD